MIYLYHRTRECSVWRTSHQWHVCSETEGQRRCAPVLLRLLPLLEPWRTRVQRWATDMNTHMHTLAHTYAHTCTHTHHQTSTQKQRTTVKEHQERHNWQTRVLFQSLSHSKQSRFHPESSDFQHICCKICVVPNYMSNTVYSAGVRGHQGLCHQVPIRTWWPRPRNSLSVSGLWTNPDILAQRVSWPPTLTQTKSVSDDMTLIWYAKGLPLPHTHNEKMQCWIQGFAVTMNIFLLFLWPECPETCPVS